MRKLLSFLLLLTSAVAIPALATTTNAPGSRDQSYFSYDDGGTVVRQNDDDRELEVRINMPVYPGDEVITNRRGRSEIRLSDGNVLALDRATSVVLHSVLDSYEGESSSTIAELRYGKAIVYRTEDARESMRLDTNLASYVASREAIYSVEYDTSGRDRVTVFGGTVEVRTPSRTTRVRAGEEVEIDKDGPYRFASDTTASADDFERWFLARADRYNTNDSRYLDARHAYYEDELSEHGKWVFVNGLGWSWRPLVAAGWRPYYHGYWASSRTGCLTWVSYEPWGWLPYHYGRWALDSVNGWVWLPGSGYSPAWVYWWYGDGYMGWAPSGYWEAYRPYHDWAYRPYSRNGASMGFGFYGRVRVKEVDLRPWTFIDSNTIVSTRVDRAALTADAIRSRLLRDGNGFGTISSAPARFTRQEFKNPAAAINRRINGGNSTTVSAGPIEDMTPFIRRESDLTPKFRDRFVQLRGGVEGGHPGSRSGLAPSGGSGGVAPVAGGSVAPTGGGSLAPIGRGSVAPIGTGSVAPIGGGSLAPTTSGDGGRVYRGGPNTGAASTPANGDGSNWRTDGGRISRGTEPEAEPAPSTRGTVGRNREASPAPAAEPATRDTGRTWRDRVMRPATPSPGGADRSATPSTENGTTSTDRDRSTNRGSSDTWRGRTRGAEPAAPSSSATPAPSRPAEGSGSISRRVIDRIGGARIQPSGGDSSGRAAGSRGTRDTSSGSGSTTRTAPAPTPAPSSSSGTSQRSSGGDSGGGKIDRTPQPDQQQQ